MMTVNNLRDKLLLKRSILVTGNPDNPKNLAYGFKKIYPDATFIHKSAGWDLEDLSDENNLRLQNLFKNYNTFINASYIGPYIQTKLLEIFNQSQKFCDIFNIGSTHEFDGLGTMEYTNSKLNLRDTSLKLNSYRCRTHHIILGGIKNPYDSSTNILLEIHDICNIVPWIIQQNFNIPIICMDQPKEPW